MSFDISRPSSESRLESLLILQYRLNMSSKVLVKTDGVSSPLPPNNRSTTQCTTSWCAFPDAMHSGYVYMMNYYYDSHKFFLTYINQNTRRRSSVRANESNTLNYHRALTFKHLRLTKLTINIDVRIYALYPSEFI